jgi:ankyrin repeat protein
VRLGSTLQRGTYVDLVSGSIKMATIIIVNGMEHQDKVLQSLVSQFSTPAGCYILDRMISLPALTVELLMERLFISAIQDEAISVVDQLLVRDCLKGSVDECKIPMIPSSRYRRSFDTLNPFHYACWRNSIQLAAILVNHGADEHRLLPCSCSTDNGREKHISPLFLALDSIAAAPDYQLRRHSFTREFLQPSELGISDIGEDDAAYSGNTRRRAMIQWLISRGASGEVPQLCCWSPLQAAVSRGQQLIVRDLLRANADPNFKTNRNLERRYFFSEPGPVYPIPLMELFEQTLPRDLRENIFLDLVDAGADPCSVDRSHLLNRAVGMGSLQLVKKLKACGAQPDDTTLSLACGSGELDLVGYLLTEWDHPQLSRDLLLSLVSKPSSEISIGLKLNAVTYFHALSSLGLQLPSRSSQRYMIQRALDLGDCVLLRKILQLDVPPFKYGDYTRIYLTQNNYDKNQEDLSLVLDAGALVESEALGWALMKGDLQSFLMLLPRCPTADETSLIQAAVLGGEPAIVEVVLQLDEGLDINARGTHHYIWNMMRERAAMADCPNLMKTFETIESMKLNQLTALQTALAMQDQRLVAILIAAGADVNCGSPTPLCTAVRTKNLGLFQYLLECGADPCDTGALVEAVSCRIHKIVYFILAAQTTVHKTPSILSITAALHEAISVGDLELIELFLSSGASLGSLEKQRGSNYEWSDHSLRREQTALGAAVQACGDCCTHRLDIVRKLLSAGANPNRPHWAPSHYRTCLPLDHAITLRRYDVAEVLVQHGAHISFKPTASRRLTPLQRACEIGDPKMFDLLLRLGADIATPAGPFDGQTALQLASTGGRVYLTAKLLELGADPNGSGCGNNGHTALEGAAAYGRLDVVQLLLDGGAQIRDSGEEQYRNAVRFAEQRGHWAVVKLLKAAKEGANSELKNFVGFEGLDEFEAGIHPFS